jgi:hypothetical protein
MRKLIPMIILLVATGRNAAADTPPGITAEHLYNGVNRPARVTVTSPRSFGKVTLALMDFEGNALAEPVDVYPGVIDLGEQLPVIWTFTHGACNRSNRSSCSRHETHAHQGLDG